MCQLLRLPAGKWTILKGHYILIKNDSKIHLSIPVHKNKTLGVGLLKKLINKAGLTNEEYLEYFYGK
jgi:hypothetical protein